MRFSDISLSLSGRSWSIDCAYAHRFDARKPTPSRAIWSLGWRKRYTDYSILFQVYRPGKGLDWHTDGDNFTNKVWGVVLWKPRRGGELEVEGPLKRWWRFHHFDGGQDRHRVTPCEGHRAVLMFQIGKPMHQM